MTSPFSREHFTEQLNALAEPTKRFQILDSQIIPDMLLYHLVLDVLEQARAVACIVDAGVGRPAYSNSRAAFEAALDMLVLVAVPQEYCAMGSRARAYEVVDLDRLRATRGRADEVLGFAPSQDARTPDEIIESEADDWDSHSPGKGQLLREALVAIKSQRPALHWSGLNKAQIGDRIAAISGDPVGVREMIHSLYSLQSLQAHPGARTSLRQISVKADGTLFVEPLATDLQGPLGLTSMAATLALIAISRRPQEGAT